MTPSRRLHCALSCALIATLLPVAAIAQEGFQVDQFSAMPAQGTNLLNLSGSEVLGHLEAAAGLFVHGQDDPLQVIDHDTGEVVSRVVDQQVKAELTGAIGLFDLVDVGLALPLILSQSGEGSSDLGLDEFSGLGVSDIRLIPKLRAMDAEQFGGFGVAVALPIHLPTGDTETFSGEGKVRVEPRMAVDWTSDFLSLVANVGVAFRPQRVAVNHVNGTSFRYGLGARVPIVQPVSLITTWYGSLGLQPGRDPENLEQSDQNRRARPMELLGGAQFDLPADLIAQIGGGSGLNGGIGSPDFRLFASLGYTPRGPRDADEDGIVDPDDACPDVAEDLDEFADSDGCPDLDNDGDGIPDVRDQCPDHPEDVDDYLDEDGCPEDDNDQDGVLDVEDECPTEPGDAELAGCPRDDADGDGIGDKRDLCPNDAEDEDGFEDGDGCPDLDNDGDGIPDANDQCPRKKEVINGVDDEDGCPDEGETKVRVTSQKIEILEKVFFDTNEATIQARSHNVLNQVASTLNANPQITKIRIEGHTDSRGPDDHNLELSQRRAEAVMNYLAERGVERGRMDAVGFGELEPIADNTTELGREENRRVDFTIVEVDDEPAREAK